MKASKLVKVNQFFNQNNLRQTEKNQVKARMMGGETFIQAMVNVEKQWFEDEQGGIIFNEFSTEYESFAFTVNELLKGRIENPFNPFNWVIVRHPHYTTDPYRVYHIDDPYLQEYPAMYVEVKRTHSQDEAFSDCEHYNKEWEYSH